MLVIHVYVTGKQGQIERSYDFMQNDNKEELTGVDCVLPYDDELEYPLSEFEAIGLSKKYLGGDH